MVAVWSEEKDSGRYVATAVPNGVAREVALPSPHTTEHAGPHEAVQAGGEARSRISLKAGSMTRRLKATTWFRSVFVEAVIPPPCLPCSVLRPRPWEQAKSYYDGC